LAVICGRCRMGWRGIGRGARQRASPAHGQAWSCLPPARCAGRRAEAAGGCGSGATGAGCRGVGAPGREWMRSFSVRDDGRTCRVRSSPRCRRKRKTPGTQGACHGGSSDRGAPRSREWEGRHTHRMAWAGALVVGAVRGNGRTAGSMGAHMGLPDHCRSWGKRRGAVGVACECDCCDPGGDAPAVGGTRGHGGGLGSCAGAARERRCDGSGPAP